MKTITEFAVLTLKNAAQTKQELTTAGKTAEELPAAMGEALKLEGDKLNHILNAVELVGTKFNDLKRVVVMTLAEGEKAPHGAVQKGEQVYRAEYYAPLNAPKGRDSREERGRGGKGGDRGKGKRGGGRRGEGRGEGRGGEGRGRDQHAGAPGHGGGRDQQAGAPGQTGGEAPQGERRGPRPPRRGPRPERAPGQTPTENKGPLGLIKPKNAESAAPVAPPAQAAPEQPSSETKTEA